MKINGITSYKLPFYKFSNTNTGRKHPISLQNKQDTVSFSSLHKKHNNTNVDIDTANFIAQSLSRSTSGHRAPYGSKTFNKDVVKLITLGVAEYAKEEASKKGKSAATVLIGGDSRNATKESLPIIADTLLKQNINVLHIKEPTPSPLIAMEAEKLNADITVLMTASHNPWEDGGYNFLTPDGAVAPQRITKKISDNIINLAKRGFYTEVQDNTSQEIDINPLDEYTQLLNSLNLINWESIKNAGISISYDGLQGAGIYTLPEILKEHEIPFNQIHSSGQIGPNPTEENLSELKNFVISDTAGNIKIGLANDGDADRFGVIDEKGNFIPANDVLLLIAYHLVKNKGYSGTIIRSQATTKELDSLARLYGIDIKETPVGFKYVGEDILKLREQGKDILIAGEESGGLTLKGHIPEKDGIIADLLILDLIATEGNPISKILNDIKSQLPISLGISHFSKKYPTDNDKQTVMDRFVSIYERAQNGNIQFSDTHLIDIEKTNEHLDIMKKYKEDGDGIKLFLTDGSTILVRKSGTEPLLRCYIEAAGDTQQHAQDNMKLLKRTMDNIFTL